jgi:uncharacterized protein YegP (UPF0339 family)
MKKLTRSLVLLFLLAGSIGLFGLDGASAQEKKEKDKGKAPPAVGTFEVYKDAGMKFRFRLKNEEGVTLAIASHGYENKADCQKVIDSIKALAAKAKVEDEAK